MTSVTCFQLVISLMFLLMMIQMHSWIVAADGEGESMDEVELVGLYEVMGSLLEDPDWAQEHPYPCTETPWPGLECGEEMESSDSKEGASAQSPLFHVTKIHVGPDVLSPPCKPSATLSPSLIKLPYLKTLSIFNCFVKHPVSLSSPIFNTFSSLEHISIVSNPSLVGHIPPSLSQVSGLKVLNLGQNNLQGLIPKEIGKLEILEQLDLSYNNITGSVPEQLGHLKSLTILNLCNNRLFGTIPYSIGQLQQLQKMDMSSNNLVGTIPQSLGQLSKLVLLDLTHNAISGPIPDTLSGLAHLQYLLISNNPINSDIPIFLKYLKKLTTLSLSSCGLKGNIPTYFPFLEILTSLSLSNNSLNGTVPKNLATLPHLNHLNLSFNQLQGELQLPQLFINRLGSRLDIKGNTALTCHCKSNITTSLQSPQCSSTVNKTLISGNTQTHGDHIVNQPWSKSNKSRRPWAIFVILQFILSNVIFSLGLC